MRTKEYLRQYQKQYRLAHAEKRKKYMSEYHNKYKEYFNPDNRRYDFSTRPKKIIDLEKVLAAKEEQRIKEKEYNIKYYHKNKDKINAKRSLDYKNAPPEYREELRLRNVNYYKRFPEKRRAHDIFNNEKFKKRTILMQPCEICGKEKTNAHHDDYNKPLDVRWLCVLHHRRFHAEHTYDPVSFTYIKKI